MSSLQFLYNQSDAEFHTIFRWPDSPKYFYCYHASKFNIL